MPLLQTFPYNEVHVDLAQEISDFKRYGLCLLEDCRGVKMDDIFTSERGHPVKINNWVFSEWVVGRGKRPVMWRSTAGVPEEGATYRDNERHIERNGK